MLRLNSIKPFSDSMLCFLRKTVGGEPSIYLGFGIGGAAARNGKAIFEFCTFCVLSDIPYTGAHADSLVGAERKDRLP